MIKIGIPDASRAEAVDDSPSTVLAVRQCVGHRANLEGIIGLSLPHKASGFTITGVLCLFMSGNH